MRSRRVPRQIKVVPTNKAITAPKNKKIPMAVIDHEDFLRTIFSMLDLRRTALTLLIVPVTVLGSWRFWHEDSAVPDVAIVQAQQGGLLSAVTATGDRPVVLVRWRHPVRLNPHARSAR